MKTLRFSLLVMLLAFLLLPAANVFGQAQDASRPVLVLTGSGALTPILPDYLERGLAEARGRGAQALILELNTPGGSVDILNRIVQIIRGSDVPVVVYVTPRGAMAASAGAVITFSAHVAAMAPETTIGAASPVGSQGEDIGETLETKVKEILKADARNLTGRRGEKAMRLAEEMIESARAVTAQEALDAGLIDFQSDSLESLMASLDGRSVETAGGTVMLHTREAPLQRLPQSLIEQWLQLLVNPNLVFLLLSVGVQAILIEISSPGGWVAGFGGAVCLLLAVYGMGFLPVNWFGGLFLLLAFVLFILDIKAPTHGALTAAGAVTFAAGALVLFNSSAIPGAPKVSVPLVIGTAFFIAAAFFFAVSLALKAQRTPIWMGREALPGQSGVAQTEIRPEGMVHVGGEQWVGELAPGEEAIPEGGKVQVVEVKGLRLVVRRKD